MFTVTKLTPGLLGGPDTRQQQPDPHRLGRPDPDESVVSLLLVVASLNIFSLGDNFPLDESTLTSNSFGT